LEEPVASNFRAQEKQEISMKQAESITGFLLGLTPHP
jgi:hypothetical protein